MFEKVESQVSLPELERRVLRFWEECGTFDAVRRKNEGKPRWSFLDGPITANDEMKVHHAWGRTYKDLWARYRSMRGFEVRNQNGFDCQGLWVEVEVEKELGFKTKRDIEEYGIEKFVEQCKERVRKYSGIQADQSVRLGYWMDWNDSYFTMTDENNYTIWSFLKRCHDRGFIYKGFDSMPWCPRCGVGLSQMDFDTSLDYAKERIQFGRPIGSFQAIQHKFANMIIDVDGSRFITYKAAWALQENEPDAEMLVSMAKAWCNEATRRVVAHGQQIHGGIGFTKDYKIELYFRRQKWMELMWGDADYHRELVAAKLEA